MVFVEEYTIAIAEKLLSPSLDSLSSYEGKQTIMPIYSEMFCADDFLNVETCSTCWKMQEVWLQQKVYF